MAPDRSHDRRLLEARLAAQRLSGEAAGDPLEATRHLLAIQAQDPRGARLAVRVRTHDGHASDVENALNERALVVTTVNRGTLHLVAAEDEPLLHVLTTPQLRTSNNRRLMQEGVSPAAAARGARCIAAALEATGPMTRERLRCALERADVPVAGQALVHLLLRATLDGRIVRGPMVGREQAFVLAADWLGERPRVDRGRALGELAHRYLRGHGPADERDLAKWAGLPLRDARAGLGSIASTLHHRPDGLVDLPRDQLHLLPPPRLLGPFDPVLLGWRSRDLVLEGAQEVVTANGMFKAIALVEGCAAGTWTMRGGRVQLELWREPRRATATALQAEAAAVEAYLAPCAPAR